MSHKWYFGVPKIGPKWYMVIVYSIALLGLIVCQSTHADVSSIGENPQQCENTLNACLTVIKEEDASVALLKKQITTLEKQVSTSQSPTIFSKPFCFIIGALTATLIAYTIHH